MRAASLLPALLASLALLPASACMVDATGGDDQVGDDDDQNPGGPDAGGEERQCVVPDQMGTALVAAEAARRNQQGSMGALQYYDLVADFDATATPDLLNVQLFDQRGPFTGDVVPGTYTISGAEASLQTCAVCVVVLGDLTAGVGAQQFFHATSGTVTITAVEPTLTGSISNATFEEFDGATGAPIADGCTTSVSSLDFSATVTVVDGGGGGGGGGGGN